jgi:tetratricopeptide (TPR) repeat protein
LRFAAKPGSFGAVPGTPSRRDRSLEALLDRIEDRLMDAPIGLHRVGEPADHDALARAELPDEAAALWRRWNGIEFAGGEVELLSLDDQDEATREAGEAGILREGDRVIGRYGLASLVLPGDPWAEGGDVVMLEDDGERAPYASSVVRLALGLVAEMSLLYDDEGESRDGLFGDDGQLTPRAERRMLRRRLDFDEDAPFPRFRLGQLLRRAGELRGARAELRRVLRCAPEFAWAHWALGRVALELWLREADDAREEARTSFAAAAEKTDDPHLQALFLAWQARVVDEPIRERLAVEVKRLDPGFVAAREAGLREAIADEDGSRARELLALGLAIEPRSLNLLDLREIVDALPEIEPEAEPMPVEEVAEAFDLEDDPALAEKPPIRRRSGNNRRKR